MNLLSIAVIVAAVFFGPDVADAQIPVVPSPSPSPLPSATPSPMPSPEPTASTAATAAPPSVPAGVVPAAVDVELTGTVTPRFALAHVRAAIDARTFRQPGTGLDVHGITLAENLAPGSSLDALAGVAIAGRGAFLDVNGKTSVHVGVADLAPLEPVQLFYSDDPEYVGPADDGVLFRATVAPQSPARIFLYHVAAGAPRRVSLVLQTSGTPARVQVVGAAVGPSPQYAYVGQQTTARFLSEHAAQEGVLLDLAPDVPFELPLATLQPGDLIEAIEDLRIVSGGTVVVSVVTNAGATPLATLLTGPELGGDTHDRRGVYPLTAIAPIDLALTVGADEPDPVTVGDDPLENLRAGGRVLAGDYGVARRIALTLANPTDRPTTAYLWERTAGGGGATVTLLFDGDAAPTLVPCVNDPVQPRLVRAFDLAPGTTQTIGGTFMTDGASSYPIELGVTLTPPLPVLPGACSAPPS
jgi:hypothetical protein